MTGSNGGFDIDPHADEPIVTAGAPPAAATAALVLLHGWGGSPEDVLRLVDELHHHGVLYLAPAAAGRVWYPGDVEGATVDREGHLTSGFDRIGAAIEMAADAGVGRNRVVLFGFSQGACLASEYAARRPTRYGGVVAVAGGLLGPIDDFDRYEGSLDGTPVFLGAGRDDPHVSPDRIETAADTFRRLDSDVTARLYDDLGHYVNDDEMRALDEIVARTVP